jgi:hypothetical protein
VSPNFPSLRTNPGGWLGQILLLVAVWLSLIKLPGAPLVSLDASWQMVIGYAAEHGLQHGTDIVFTYGPLGYLLASTYMGSHFTAFLVWQIAGNFLIAVALYRFGRELTGWRQALYYGYVLLFGSIYADAMQMNFIAIFSLLLMRPACRQPLWLISVGAAFGLFSLMKFTNLLVCLFSLAVLCVYFLLTRARREAAWLAGAFVLTFLGVWLLHEQSLAALPAFFYYGLQVSLGYVEAMAVYEQPAMLAVGLLSLGSIIGYALLYLFGQADRRAALTAAVLLGAVIFINWKHGFVRADGHVIAHFVMCLLVVCSYPALTADSGRFGRAKAGCLLLAAACSLTGIGMVSVPAVTQAPGGWNQRIHQTVSSLLNPAAFHRSLDEAMQRLATQIDQPNLRHIVGRSPVDHFGGDQIYTLLNRFNYTPRPTIQSYTAYTEPLNRLDEQFYLSNRGPDFVIQRFRSIDERFPSLDDSLTLRLLLHSYNYVMEEGGLLLWERPEKLSVPGPDTEMEILQRTVRFSEKVAVAAGNDRPVWAVIKVRPNLIGSLRKFFYKAPLLYLDTTDDKGVKESHQLIRAMAATGFILNPYFTQGDDLIAFQNGRFHRRIVEFSVRTMPGGESYFDEQIDIELRTLAPFKQALVDANRKLNNRFRMMNRRPTAIESEVPMSSLLLDGKEVLMLHAASRMDFALAEPVRQVTGRFGLLPGSYQDGHDTDGVEFVVEFVSATGEAQVLFRRFLDPLRAPGDRPTQSFTVQPPQDKGGKLIFKTLPGPRGSQSFDWSYWTDLEFR